jgi:hypothetical protein
LEISAPGVTRAKRTLLHGALDKHGSGAAYARLGFVEPYCPVRGAEVDSTVANSIRFI